MSSANRLTTSLESHPKLMGVLLTGFLLLSTGVSTVAASSGATVGP